MEKLLQWSIASANGDQETMKKIGAPDPKALAELFGAGGPDEPTLMKQAMVVITNSEAELEAKEIAFDNFEMLIENLDNANNIENLKLWEPLLKQLHAEEEILRKYACSVIGTAVQNNVKSQEDLLKYRYAVSDLIRIARNTDNSEALRVKAIYALSNFIRHNGKAYKVFDEEKGWDLIRELSVEKSERIGVRLQSLLTSIISTGSTPEIQKNVNEIFKSEKAKEILESYQ